MVAHSDSDQRATDIFERHRPMLQGVAYRMLGRVMDAEDVVQEAWIRWHGVDRDQVREPAAYLVRITTRLALDRLDQAQYRRETYVGPWLPDPLETDLLGEPVPDTAERITLAESVSVAVLVVLESLSPLERAVFVLREAFAYPYAEIAEILERSESAVRQLARRARAHVDEHRPRFDADPGERRELTERFLAATVNGDLQGLLAVLAPDARLVGDSGGKAKAPRRVLHSADKVARFLAAVGTNPLPDPTVLLREVNGAPGVVILSEGRPDSVFQLEVEDGLVRTVYIMRNPERLAHLTPLT